MPRAGAVDPFAEAISTITGVRLGQEASMYGAIRDLITDQLGYPRANVVIDTAGEGGRPDLTVRAPSGIGDGKVDWLVIEAKDEHDAFTDVGKRERIFAKKAKYVGPDTAWFVMVDPRVIVARSTQTAASASGNDIVLPLTGKPTAARFREQFAALAFERAGVPERLRTFRDGDLSMIATERLLALPGAGERVRNQAELARRNFYATLRTTTAILQTATHAALVTTLPVLNQVVRDVEEFGEKYNGWTFHASNLSVVGSPKGLELTRAHDREAARLKRSLQRHPQLTRLALEVLPEFRARTSTQSAKEFDKAIRMFATETANLVLARILLLRFLEDHGFFGDRRYLCNGGVEAFQHMKDYFGLGYTKLLEDAYHTAGRLYSAAFDETGLDWIFAADDQSLSSSIEWAMYQLSRYDFTTVRGDILTGIYDRFLDRGQRKEFGEYYTPPSIARYVLDRLKVVPTDQLLDPACGSGTFLIEAFEKNVGEDAARGLATYADMVAVLERIAGNDINVFSSVLTQIQLLWHLLVFKDEIVRRGFPELFITGKANSLARQRLETAHSRFAEIDQPQYDAVVGNPPYVRPERGGDLDAQTTAYFDTAREAPGTTGWAGISAKSNVYNLFLYRALDSWCRQPNAFGRGAGRLGFVLPLSFCDANENADVRRLLGPGGRWTVREIVDLEVIWKLVFDADVLPIVLLCEARPPRLPIPPEWLSDKAEPHPDPATRRRIWDLKAASRARAKTAAANARGDRKRASAWQGLENRFRERAEPDEVIVRPADRTCVDFGEGERRPQFALDRIEEKRVPYDDLFSPDARILTRLTPGRLPVVRKLRACGTLADTLRQFWVRTEKNSAVEWQLQPPRTGQRGWERREMIATGVAFRRQLVTHRKKGAGLDVYKAENILAAGVHGTPQATDVDVSQADAPYLWRYADILPERMFAVATIATCPNAVGFDPSVCLFTNTAVVFGPKEELAEFPFDLLFVSRIYRFYYAVALRMAALNSYRSHIYPTNLRLLPWSDALACVGPRIDELRGSFMSVCRNAFKTEEAMQAALDKIPSGPARQVVRDAGARIFWSPSLQLPESKIDLVPGELGSGTDGTRVRLSEQDFDWLEIDDPRIADLLHAGLMAAGKDPIDRAGILAQRIPRDAAALAEWRHQMTSYRTADHKDAVERAVDQLDDIVGPALGLNEMDLGQIKREMAEDSFLRNIGPRYPSTSTRLHGFRTGLDSARRYGGGADDVGETEETV